MKSSRNVSSNQQDFGIVSSVELSKPFGSYLLWYCFLERRILLLEVLPSVYPIEYAYGCAVLCLVVDMNTFPVDPCDWFSHIVQGYFTGCGISFPLCQCGYPEWCEENTYIDNIHIYHYALLITRYVLLPLDNSAVKEKCSKGQCLWGCW